MTTEITVRPSSEFVLASDNRFAVECLTDRLGLPAPTIVTRSDVVFVMVADVDDLGVWLDVLGGAIRVTPSVDGVELWTLHTRTEPRSDGSTVPVRVSVPVPAGELVQAFIADAREAVSR